MSRFETSTNISKLARSHGNTKRMTPPLMVFRVDESEKRHSISSGETKSKYEEHFPSNDWFDLSYTISPALLHSHVSNLRMDNETSNSSPTKFGIASFCMDVSVHVMIDLLYVAVVKSVPLNLILLRRRRSNVRLERKMIPKQNDALLPKQTAKGITNYGQTCFLNSVLQALASLDPFLIFVTELNESLSVESPYSRFVSQLLILLETINGQRDGSVDPRSLLQMVAEHHSQFSSFTREQQDAQEVLQAMMDVLTDASIWASKYVEDKSLSLSPFHFVDIHDEQCNRTNSARNMSGQNCDSTDEDYVRIEKPDDSLMDEEEKKQDDTYSLNHMHHPYTHGMTSFEENRKTPNPKSSYMAQTVKSNALPSGHVTDPPFHGWLGSTLQCSNCRHVKPIQNEVFLNIGIVPTSISKYINEGSYFNQPCKNSPASKFPTCSLTQGVQNFTAIERVHDVECRKCTILQEISRWEEEVLILEGAVQSLQSRSKLAPDSAVVGELRAAKEHLSLLRQLDPDEIQEVPSGPTDHNSILFVPLCRNDAWKCLLLTRLPKVLCFHIQRRYYDPRRDTMAKSIQHVTFEEVVDFGKFSAYCGEDTGMIGKGDRTRAGTKNNRVPVLYQLMCVVEHTGNAFSGHYVAYRRDVSNPGRWLYISDHQVLPVSWEVVKGSQAYMLFYSRI
jgi:Ubiquitin carboxyl-terminal hydrolase